MIYKRCPRCGKRLPSGETCPCIKTEKKYKREYAPPEGTRKLYHSYRWQKLQQTVMAMYGGTDQWELARGRVAPAQVVHHIIPAEEAPELFWSPSNLIPLSRASHDEVHALYREGAEQRERAMSVLRAHVRTLG